MLRDEQTNVQLDENALANDLSDLHRSRLLTQQNAILEKIAAGSPLTVILTDLTRMVEEQTEGFASVLILDSERGCLNVAAAENIPFELQQICQDLPIGPTVGSCGRAAFLAEPVFSSDVELDENWVEFRQLMRDIRLRACWSVPIFAKGSNDSTVLGTFAIYFPNPVLPEANTFDWLKTAAHLASIAIGADRMSKSLSESESRFRLVMDNAAAGIYIHDELGYVVDANRKACENLGYTREELLGMAPVQFDPRCTLADLETMSERLISGGGEWTFESIHYRKDGTSFPVEVRMRQYQLQDRKGTVCLVSDITERNRLRDQRNELLRLLWDTQELTKLGSFEWEVESDELNWSNELYRIFGVNPMTPVTMATFANAIHEEDRPQVLKVMRGAIEHCSAFEMQKRIVRPSGEIRILETRGRVIANGEGKAVRVVGACHDVTDRNRANEELNYTASLLQQVVSGSTDLIFLKDLEGRYLFCNASVARFVQRPEAEIIGARADTIFTLSESTVMKRQDAEVIRTGESKTYENELSCDGSLRTISTTKSPFRGRNGEIIGVFGISRDITERKRSETELRHWNSGLRLLAGAAARFLASRLDDTRTRLLSEIAGHLHCSAYLSLDFVDGALHLREWFGLSEPNATSFKKVGLGQFPIGLAAQRGELLHVDYTKLCQAVEMEHLRERGIRSIVVVPLVFEGQLFGTVAFCSTHKDAFDHWELEFIKLVGLLATAARRREHSEAELVDSERRFRELVNAIPELVWISDATGKVIDGNPLARQVVGEFEPEIWLNAIHIDCRKIAGEKWKQAAINKSSYQQELRVFNQISRRYEWFLAQAIPSLDHNGTITAWYGTAINIDEIKQTESALRSSEAQLKAIFDTSNAGIIEADTSGKILRVNETLCRMFQRTQDELLKQNFVELLYPEQAPHDLSQFERLIKGHIRDYRIDQNYFRGSGTEMHVHISLAVARQENDRPVAIAAVIVDVSAIKRLEEHVRQSQKMEAIGRLAGGVAHDFNNILTVILSTSELLLMRTRTDPKLMPDISAIHDSAVRAAGLTKQLLAFSRKQLLKPTVLNPNEMIRKTDQLLRRAIGDEIVLKLELDDNVPPIVTDPSQFQQVLLNLAINARDAMPRGGTLRIRTRTSSGWKTNNESASNIQDQVEIIFEDDGLGIPGEILPRIFEPFFSTKDIGKGTGLGLAVVHGIVEQSGGQVRAVSVQGQGTQIQILLPASLAVSAEVSESQTRGTLPQGSGTILIVDDEEGICRVAASILEKCGYEVHTANNPLQAIELVAQKSLRIDMLLTDIAMPKMRGNELAENLQRLIPELKVAFMSGFTDQSEMPEMFEGRFLAKPFSPAGLSTLVHAMMGASRV
jgi:two-component system, cell cycle sensor histidine kinase and response regulator CckA